MRHNHGKYHATRGLRSGERNTNFTNSMLNKVQLDMAVDDAELAVPGTGKIQTQYHKGDDVALITDSWLHAVAIN